MASGESPRKGIGGRSSLSGTRLEDETFRVNESLLKPVHRVPSEMIVCDRIREEGVRTRGVRKACRWRRHNVNTKSKTNFSGPTAAETVQKHGLRWVVWRTSHRICSLTGSSRYLAIGVYACVGVRHPCKLFRAWYAFQRLVPMRDISCLQTSVPVCWTYRGYPSGCRLQEPSHTPCLLHQSQGGGSMETRSCVWPCTRSGLHV
jgi:hypothetical protein